jgi:hypothetical protein
MSTRRPSGSSHQALRPFGGTPPVANRTLRLPNAPPIPGRNSKPPPAPARPSLHPEAGIEIQVVEQPGVQTFDETSWALFEIWTRNRVYHVNSEFRCIAVVSRATAQQEPGHALMGARLTGGERRNKSAHLVDIYFPLPGPGTEAVFKSDSKRHGQFAKTSTIERVVMRVRRVRINTVAEGQVWDERLGRSNR